MPSIFSLFKPRSQRYKNIQEMQDNLEETKKTLPAFVQHQELIDRFTSFLMNSSNATHGFDKDLIVYNPEPIFALEACGNFYLNANKVLAETDDINEFQVVAADPFFDQLESMPEVQKLDNPEIVNAIVFNTMGRILEKLAKDYCLE
ncbi:hypothetical protein ACD631_16260 [Alteromonas macleodii]|mgnify:CR=1 FL=1|uniref:hypothetical protein n=1 Tax=Alteromonas macleodii TaxID=28108 RepID=UPI0036F4A6C3